MSDMATMPRYLARLVVGHAAGRLSWRRASWADPMRCEVDAIENDFSALRWAAGCVVATYMERISVMRVASISPVFGVFLLLFLTFGGYYWSGGHMGMILEPLPHVLMTVLGGALAATYLVTSGGGAGVWRSIGQALRGRRFGRDDYRMLATVLGSELNGDTPSDALRNYRDHRDAATANMIRDGKALMEHNQMSAEHIGGIFQARIDALATDQQRNVKVLQTLTRSLLWFGGLAFFLGTIKFLGSLTEPPEVVAGMLGSATTGPLLGVLLGIGLVLPLASRLDAIIAMDARFYAFIRTAFVCRAAGVDAALAVQTANGALPPDLALDDSEIRALPGTFPSRV